MVNPVPTRILFIYLHYQPQMDSLRDKVEFRKTITEDDLTKEALNNEHSYLILDDMVTELSDNFLQKLFTR